MVDLERQTAALERQRSAITAAETSLQSSITDCDTENYQCAIAHALQGILSVLVEQLHCFADATDTTNGEDVIASGT